jgi:hypothetical protein
LDPENGWPKTPLSALVDGPLVGGEWEAHDTTPRSIHVDYWEIVCPPSERYQILSHEIKDPVYAAEGEQVFRRAVQMLRETPARCVEVIESPTSTFYSGSNSNTAATDKTLMSRWSPIYALDLLLTPRSLSLSKILLDSATSRLLRPSTVVSTAISQNLHLFAPRRGPLDVGTNTHVNTNVNTNSNANASMSASLAFDRTLAVHVRRGDFNVGERADWAWTYHQW